MIIDARSLLLISALGLLAACQPSGSGGRNISPPVANDPHLAMQLDLERGGMDLSNLVIVRLTEGSKRVEVTSMQPAVLASIEIDRQTAKTIFRINQSSDALILFSRDLPNARSFRSELQLTELEARKGFVFAVVQPDGSLKEKSFVLEKILRPDFSSAK